jgi:hypothetical protein
MDGSMFDGCFAAVAILVGLVVFFAVAAIFGWVPALWTGGGLVVASIIRYAGR